jgi:hypothetical protein
VHVEDNEDGTYDVSYTPTEVGPHRVSIHVKSQSLSGSPFTAQVEKFVDAAKCVAEGEGLSGEVTTNKPLVFTVKLFAPNGEPVHEGGDKVDVKITSTSSGTYRAQPTAPHTPPPHTRNRTRVIADSLR